MIEMHTCKRMGGGGGEIKVQRIGEALQILLSKHFCNIANHPLESKIFKKNEVDCRSDGTKVISHSCRNMTKLLNVILESMLVLGYSMQWVLMSFNDEECMLILKNCYNALPEKGKVIACEPVLPEETDNRLRTRALLENDIYVMTIYRAQGRSRTEEEFRQLGLSVGFTGFKVIDLGHFHTVIEFHK